MQSNFLKANILFLLLFIQFKSNAQSYNTGVGIRLGGYENGLTVKHFIDSKTAIEGILGLRPGAFVLTGLYEKHQNAFDTPNLNWYYGIGAHIGGVGRGRSYRRYKEDRYYENRGILFGADAILGIEWVIPELPISIGADLHPRLELLNGPFIDLEPAVSIRYVF